MKLLPVQYSEPISQLVLKAAEIKAEHPMSYADSFVVATAQSVKGTIITGNPEFKSVEEKVKILWMGK